MGEFELELLKHSTKRWQAGEIDGPSYAGLYFLHWQLAKHGKRFASRRHRIDPRPDPLRWFQVSAELSGAELRTFLSEYFRRYQFLGIINPVPLALAEWLENQWPLRFCEFIPTPMQVLAMQVEGTRPVTVISSWPRLNYPVLSKPDAFAFMVHDLEHAHKFYHCPDLHQQQLELFRLLSRAIGLGWFQEYFTDPLFMPRFDYLISDMNTHTMHASQYLRAILMEVHMRWEKVSHPVHLTQGAQEAVTGLLTSLFGKTWVQQVENRMIRPERLVMNG